MTRRWRTHDGKMGRVNTCRMFLWGLSLIGATTQCSAFCSLQTSRPSALTSTAVGGRRSSFAGKHHLYSFGVAPLQQQSTGNKTARHRVPRMMASSAKSKLARKRKTQPRRGGPSTFAEGYTAEAFVKMRHEVAYQVAQSRGARNHKKFSLTGGLDSCPCLVLNADYQPLSYLPLSLWGWQDVIKAVFMEKVTVVATYNNRSIRSAHMEVKLPSVIALKEFVNNHSSTPAFTRRNLFLRDGHKCQYCLKYFPPHDLSFDHVVPKKLGGKGTWENVVTACGRCNNRKSDCHPKNLRSIGMRLAMWPAVPTFHQLQAAAKKYPPRMIHETWEEFLYFESEINFEGEDDEGTGANVKPEASEGGQPQ